MQFTSFLVSALLAVTATAAVIPEVQGLEKAFPVHKPLPLDPEVALNISKTVFPRAGAIDVETAAEIAEALYDAYASIIKGIKDDKEARKQFTQAAVRNVHSATGLNAIICNVGYDTTPDTIPGLTFTKYKFDMQEVGRAVTYDLLTFPMGMQFIRKGDGGYQNWAYAVDSACRINGADVDCR